MKSGKEKSKISAIFMSLDAHAISLMTKINWEKFHVSPTNPRLFQSTMRKRTRAQLRQAAADRPELRDNGLSARLRMLLLND